MKSSLLPGMTLMTLVCLGMAAPAQDQPAAPPVQDAPVNVILHGPSCAAEACPPCASCKKVAHPTVEPVKHTCVNYDVKEEDYCHTRWVRTPILSRLCNSCCGKCDCPDECHDCGTPRTRKVLLKEIVTEEVPTAKCRVERVPACTACGTPCQAGRTNATLLPFTPGPAQDAPPEAVGSPKAEKKLPNGAKDE
jgi:hypothetical protein